MLAHSRTVILIAATACAATGEETREAMENSNGDAHAEETRTTKTLFSFDSRAARGWFSVNDDVMGGLSKSRMTFTRDGHARFSGRLSLENNGGFATVRSEARDRGLAGFDGVTLRVRGDGRRYGFTALESDRRWNVRAFRKEFTTRAGEWIEVDIPFEELELRIMGRTVRGVRIPPAEIKSLSFMIADKNTEPFALEIDWIKAYRSEEATDRTHRP